MFDLAVTLLVVAVLVFVCYVVSCIMAPLPQPLDLGAKLTFKELHEANIERLPELHEGPDWLLSQWSNAALGELGEAANIIKKIERGDFTVEEKRQALADELADTVTYLDLIAHTAGISLGHAVVNKFNRVSDRYNSRVVL